MPVEKKTEIYQRLEFLRYFIDLAGFIAHIIASILSKPSFMLCFYSFLVTRIYFYDFGNHIEETLFCKMRTNGIKTKGFEASFSYGPRGFLTNAGLKVTVGASRNLS